MSLTFAEAAAWLKTKGLVSRRPNICTIWRWSTRGIRGKRLPSHMVGGRRFVREQDLIDFLDTPLIENRATLGQALAEIDQYEMACQAEGL